MCNADANKYCKAVHCQVLYCTVMYLLYCTVLYWPDMLRHRRARYPQQKSTHSRR